LPYWSIQQAELVPACRIDVTSAKSISTVLKVAQLSQCPFAVKGGGHAAFAGGSSIKDGILINLGLLNSLTVAQDRKTVSIGSGLNWYDVYLKLDPQNLAVVGGREAGVGVSGLLLGGGISYFSGRFGYGCDNVKNYEVVLASGKIVNASPKTNSDLYWALRGGGGSNFGIVSRFDLAAFEQGLFWAGSKFHPIQAADALAKAMDNFSRAAPSDPFAHLYLAMLYVPALGGFGIASGPAYGKPVVDPPIFDEIKAAPILFDTTSIGNMSRFAAELNQTAYQRQMCVLSSEV
jgi:FAD/FMN-containing dehydrogenase